MWQHWSVWAVMVEAKLRMLKESEYRLIQDAALLQRSVESSKEDLNKKVEHLEKRLQEALQDPRKNLSETCLRLASMDARLCVVGQRIGVLEGRGVTGEPSPLEVKAETEVTLRMLGDLEKRLLGPKLEKVHIRTIAGEQKLAEQVTKNKAVDERLRKLGQWCRKHEEQVCALQEDQQVTKNKEFDERLRKLEEQTKYQEQFRYSAHFSHSCILSRQVGQLQQIQQSVTRLEGESRKCQVLNEFAAAWTEFQQNEFLDFLDDNLDDLQERRLEDVKNGRATPEECLRREELLRRVLEAMIPGSALLRTFSAPSPEGREKVREKTFPKEQAEEGPMEQVLLRLRNLEQQAQKSEVIWKRFSQKSRDMLQWDRKLEEQKLKWEFLEDQLQYLEDLSGKLWHTLEALSEDMLLEEQRSLHREASKTLSVPGPPECSNNYEVRHLHTRLGDFVTSTLDFIHVLEGKVQALERTYDRLLGRLGAFRTLAVKFDGRIQVLEASVSGTGSTPGLPNQGNGNHEKQAPAGVADLPPSFSSAETRLQQEDCR